jgi:hypothetical protein
MSQFPSIPNPKRTRGAARIIATAGLVGVIGIGYTVGGGAGDTSGATTAADEQLQVCPLELIQFGPLPATAPTSVVTPGTVLTGLGIRDTIPTESPAPTAEPMVWEVEGNQWYGGWVAKMVNGQIPSSAGRGFAMSDQGSGTYTVTQDDVGAYIWEAVYLSVHKVNPATGLPTGQINPCSKALRFTPPVFVQTTSTVGLSFVKPTIKRTATPTATVKVTTPGLDNPVGRVTVSWKDGSTVGYMGPADKGKIKVALPKLPKGTYQLSATFEDWSGSATDSATDRTTKLKVK